MSFTFLTAQWRKLIMAQYEVDPARLEPYLPPWLELDLYHAGGSRRCFVSLVGFLFDRVRILGVPVPLHTRFEEVNLRFYVRRPMPDGSCRRGVVFISEVVSRPAIVLVARTLYGEPYSFAQTSHFWSSEGPGARALRHGGAAQEVRYEWTHGRRWQSLAVRAGTVLQPMAAGSLDEFITEHYWGYTAHPRSGTSEYAVEHRRWSVYPIQAYRIAADFGALYGAAFADLTSRSPDHILLAEGAPVRIRWSEHFA